MKAICQQFSEGNFPASYEYFADDVEWNVIGIKTVNGKADVVSFCQ